MCPGLRTALAVGILTLASAVALRAERLPFRLYTTADGLPSQFVNDVFRDSHGFLWFGTREGLSRFDGARFVTYGVGDGLPHLAINDILESRSGSYWIATNGGGVVRYDSTAAGPAASGAGGAASRRFVTYAIGSTRLSAHVNVVYEDAAGRIWAGSDAGLYVWNERTDVFRRVLLGLPSREDEIAVHKTLLDDGEGGLWVGTSLGLARWMADGRVVWYRAPFGGIAPPEHAVPDTSATVRAVLRDRVGKLWIGTHSGLLVHVPSKSPPGSGDPWRAADCASSRDSAGRLASMTLPEIPGTVCRFAPGSGPGGSWISALFQSVHGPIWIGSLDGLFRVDDGRVRAFGTQHGLADTTVISLAEDRDDNLWITTASGAVRLAAEGLVSYTDDDGLDATQMRWIGEDPQGGVHVASGNWLVSRYTEKGFRTRGLPVPQDPLPTWGSPAVVIDTRGDQWALTRRGLFRFQNGTATGSASRVYDRRDGLRSNHVFLLFEDSSGALWISTVSPGPTNLARLDRSTDRIHVFSSAEGLTIDTTPSAFAEDTSGAIWIGFQYGGVARYRGGRFRIFTEAHGIPAGQITSLFVDTTGRLWIGSTSGGLGRVDEPRDESLTVRTYTTADGLISDNVRCLVADREGRLYVGTGKGITRLDPGTGRVRQFTTAHGLANDFLTTAFADRHGRLWFGTLRGLSRLDPSPERPASSPTVSLAGIRVAGDPVVLPELGLSTVENLSLDPAENNVQFEFFGIGESLRFRYRLAPVDQTWLGPTDQRSITYATLAPGSYRFEVQAVTPNGVVSERPATVTFTIRTPLWRRGWFLAVLLGTVAAAVHAGYRLRLRRVLAEERIRTRIATDLHDDIGSNLSQIAILSDLAQHQAGPASESGRTLSSIATTARESVDAMSDIVWALNPRRDSFRELTQRMRAVATNLLSARNIDLVFSTDGAPPEAGFDAQMRRELLLILKEAVNNVVRHSGADRVTIEIRGHVGRLVMTVADNGRGFDPGARLTGLGLASLRQRARRLGGALTIESVPSHGTTVRLEVPLGRKGIFRK